MSGHRLALLQASVPAPALKFIGTETNKTGVISISCPSWSDMILARTAVSYWWEKKEKEVATFHSLFTLSSVSSVGPPAWQPWASTHRTFQALRSPTAHAPVGGTAAQGPFTASGSRSLPSSVPSHLRPCFILNLLAQI